MGVIVDRIVNVDATVASLAEQASLQTLDPRLAKRGYFSAPRCAIPSGEQAITDKVENDIWENRELFAR